MSASLRALWYRLNLISGALSSRGTTVICDLQHLRIPRSEWLLIGYVFDFLICRRESFPLRVNAPHAIINPINVTGNPQFDEVSYVKKGRRRAISQERIVLCPAVYRSWT
jgi:hypothetical protein